LKAVLASRLVAGAIALALVPLLWRYWTGLCNESCTPTRSLVMMGLSVVLPLSLYAAVHLGPRRAARPLAFGVALLMLGLALLAAFWVS
jgi:hypothetical protein